MFRLTRQEQFVIGVLVLLVAALVIGTALPWAGPSEPGHRVQVALNTAPQGNVESAEPPREVEPALVVHVAGAVAAPGVYELPRGARVEDAVIRAVPTKQADVNALNLAAKLVDGEKIVVPTRAEAASLAGGAPGATDAGNGADGLININTATAAELDALPGIGPSRGADIVEHRRDHPFRRIEDVMDVPGIGPGIFERIKNRITVR